VSSFSFAKYTSDKSQRAKLCWCNCFVIVTNLHEVYSPSAILRSSALCLLHPSLVLRRRLAAVLSDELTFGMTLFVPETELSIDPLGGQVQRPDPASAASTLPRSIIIIIITGA
jgi:hypothetical protein